MAIGFAPLGFYNKKNTPSGSGGFQPYNGVRPPRVDYTDAAGKNVEYLRPTQDLTQKLITDRAQGIGVGYDPKRSELLSGLVTSRSKANLADNLRDTQGALSASGLSGNPRAYEALSGRAQRDQQRSLQDSLSQIAIDDLTTAQQEKDANTSRLQNLNASNFGQENTRANFDLSAYGAENSANLGFQGLAQNQNQFDASQRNDLYAGLGQIGGIALGSYLGAPATAAIGQNLPTGQGVAPGAGTNTSNFANPNALYDPIRGRNEAYRRIGNF